MDKHYKVGEFAKNLGVSVGFLKHHERYGTFTPHISPSGYRYYEYNQAMMAVQCLRLQTLGFTSKEAAHILTHSSDLDMVQIIEEKAKKLRETKEFYEETLRYLNHHFQSFSEPVSPEEETENWTISVPEPFYYLENSSERQFIEDPQLQEIAESWMQYLPMTDIVSRVQLEPDAEPASPVSIASWNMGLTISRSAAERLVVPHTEKTRLIQPGRCLVYNYIGVRDVRKGREHLQQMLRRPLEICRKHNFRITGDIFETMVFLSTSGETSYVREVLYIPVDD